MPTTTTPPTQAQIGAWLGIAQPVVSKYARAGMPTDSLEAAAAWYDRNVNPRMRNLTNGREPVRHAIPDGRRRQPVVDDRPPGIPEDFDPARDLAMMFAPEALAHAVAIGHAALPLLKAGKFDVIKGPLQAALRAIPDEHREALTFDMDDESPASMPGSVWKELLRPVLSRMEHRSEAEEQADRESAAQQTDAESERAWRWLYQVAAGEWKFIEDMTAAERKAEGLLPAASPRKGRRK